MKRSRYVVLYFLPTSYYNISCLQSSFGSSITAAQTLEKDLVPDEVARGSPTTLEPLNNPTIVANEATDAAAVPLKEHRELETGLEVSQEPKVGGKPASYFVPLFTMPRSRFRF
jgi:hypothetical protein